MRLVATHDSSHSYQVSLHIADHFSAVVVMCDAHGTISLNDILLSRMLSVENISTCDQQVSQYRQVLPIHPKAIAKSNGFIV